MSGANIVVVQKHEGMRDLLERVCNNSPNYVEFFKEPADALYRILNDDVDIVVTGQLYNKRHSVKIQAISKPQDGPAIVETATIPVYEPKTKGTEFAIAIRQFKPHIMIFRYTCVPEVGNPQEAGIVGEIEKNFKLGPISWFLNNPHLDELVATRDFEKFKKEAPEGIKIYDDVARNYPRVIPLKT